MPKNLQLRPVYINFKECPTAPQNGVHFNATPMHKRKGGTWAQIKQARGRVTYDLDAANAHADKVTEQLEKRLIAFTKKYYPNYKVVPSTVAYRGDDLTPLRSALLMEITYAIQSYAKKEWSWVKSHMSTVHTMWLKYHQQSMSKVRGRTAVYKDAHNIHHEGNFIPVKERTTFGMRKKPVAK